MSLYIGLMSGTSADGMDAALVNINADGSVQLQTALSLPYSSTQREYLRTVVLKPELVITELLQLDRTIAQLAAHAVQQLLNQQQLAASAITALGFHGHTFYHKPQPQGFSWQIGDPSWLAEHTQITTVADFRRRDIAASGEGAPLVPAFHAACFPRPSMVLNIGGIANLTVLPSSTEQAVIGFDTGPGNALMDEWHNRHFVSPYDLNGERARSGKIIEALLDTWLAHPYFQQPPPKSTGRELFRLEQLGSLENYETADILATLCELTARSIALAVQRFGHAQGELLICGGGVHNSYLLERIRALLPLHAVNSTNIYQIDPDWVEAMAFAWLAWRTMHGLSGNLPATTGASGERILGGIFRA